MPPGDGIGEFQVRIGAVASHDFYHSGQGRLEVLPLIGLVARLQQHNDIPVLTEHLLQCPMIFHAKFAGSPGERVRGALLVDGYPICQSATLNHAIVDTKLRKVDVGSPCQLVEVCQAVYRETVAQYQHAQGFVEGHLRRVVNIIQEFIGTRTCQHRCPCQHHEQHLPHH